MFSGYVYPKEVIVTALEGSTSIVQMILFLAAFSTASGKTSAQFSESEESDPYWDCWTASQEIRNPSIRIIFGTIERVKNASHGILASKYLLCFSQKTWQRLRNLGMLQDGIPYPHDRVNHFTHVKKPSNTPATKQAIREALAEHEREISMEAVVSG
ncbi:unnamed protein product [Camellia sinensis]